MGYSSGASKECDGLIRFDKEMRLLNVIKLSESSDMADTEWLLPHIFTAFRRNDVVESVRTIAVG